MEHHYRKYWEKDNYRIIECHTCGFKHVYPIPEPHELQEFYKEKYHRQIKPFPYDRVDDAYIDRVKNRVLKDHRNQKMMLKVNELKKTPTNGLLDIGCGNKPLGFFFLDKGWSVNAIEPSLDAAEYLRKFGINVYNSFIEELPDLDISDISFVNLQFVLEHIADPFTVLTEINKVMSTGGVLRICVPNDFSEGQLAYMDKYQAEPKWVNLPDHINYFTFDSLSKLLAKARFKEVYRTTNFPLEFLLMGGLNYYASEEERNKVGPFVKNFEDSFRTSGREELLGKYYENLAQLGFGRSIYMYAIKE